nr:cysteine desulfurase-like [Nerophis lumbriciformis]
MSARRCYLDYNATAPVRPQVREAVEPLLFGALERGTFGNASSVHWAGQAARRELENARTRVASHFDRKPSEVVFTSGGSEADNLALFGALRRSDHPRLVYSAVEHPAVLAAARTLADEGVDVVQIGVDNSGQLDLEALEAALQIPTTLVSVMAVNNETGIVSPTDKVVTLAHAHNAIVHVDAVQASGRVPLPKNADLIALSGHKLGALKGVGALIIRDDIPLASTIVGGPQERGRRAGTEHVAANVSLAVALDVTEAGREAELIRLGPLRDRLDACIRTIDGSTILGEHVHRAATTTTAVFDGVDGESILQGLDLEGIATSSGSACSSGSLEPSTVLLAMGIAPALALSSVRFSLGWATNEADIEAVEAVLHAIVARARL